MQVRFERIGRCEIRGNNIEECRNSFRLLASVYDHESCLGSFDIYKCKNCKLGFTEPSPTEDSIQYLYTDRKSSDFDEASNTLIESLKDTLARRQIRKITANKYPSSVLDFSTGNGRFAVQSKIAFPQAVVHAVDHHDNIPQLINESGLDIDYFDMNDFQAEDRKYDLIILRHVLEHSKHPLNLLTSLSQYLSHSGIMYIEVPNVDSACGRLLSKWWKGWYAPRHIYHFSAASLEEIILSAGLRCQIGRNEMPLMGNTVSIMFNSDINNPWFKILGILFHPLQIFAERAFNSSSCINAICRHSTNVLDIK